MTETIPQNNPPKPVIPGTEEVESALGVKSTPALLSTQAEVNHSEATAAAPSAESVHEELVDEQLEETVSEYNRSNARLWVLYVKKFGPFVAFFLVGFFIYKFYFTDFSFNSLFKGTSQVASVQKTKSLDELYKSEQARYETWIRQYYFQITDSSVLDPHADLSGNGLSNFQKYILGLNPKTYDTLGRGTADSETLAQGVNPLSGDNLTDTQKQLIEKYIDLDVAVNKKKSAPVEQPFIAVTPGSFRGESVTSTNNVPNVASTITSTPVYTAPAPVVITQAQPVYTAPKPVIVAKPATTSKPVVVAQPTTTKPVSTTVTQQPLQPKYNKLNIPAVSNYLNIDFTIPGKLEVPSLGLSAPIVWSDDIAGIGDDLEKGIVHYPGTAFPGDLGTSYIAGHSSGYVWSKGDYNQIFAKLDSIPDKSSFNIYVTDKSGKLVTLKYVVTSRGKYLPDDPEQFKNTADSVVALSTCWPIGGTAKRLVVFGTLDSIK